MTNAIVDLFSDTGTKPSQEMRQFMAAAEVGDEQRGEDPTVNRLQAMVAEILGKEAALFLPSGTMCNQISFSIHCRPGDQIILDATAHPLNAEGGGPSALTGAVMHPLSGRRGVFTADDVSNVLVPDNRYTPRSRVVSVEQTTNLGGGACWSLEEAVAVCEVARRAGLRCHLDGARLFNAVVATGVSADRFAEPFDSAWIDLSKGLGAPVGAVLAGSADFIEEAWRFKQRFGGAMRQAGIIAAGGIYALRHNIDRLADDHANALRLAQGLAELPGVKLDPAVETNIVLFELNPEIIASNEFLDRMASDHGVRFSQMTRTVLRAVTHLDVGPDGIDHALKAARVVLGG